MFRVTSLTEMPEQQLNRWIRRIALLFLVVLIAFVALYVADRFRMPAASIVDQRLAAAEEAVRADPADVAARGQLGDLYFAAERYEDAIAQYTEILKTDESTEAASVSRGVAYQRVGNLDAAAADFEKVVELQPEGEMGAMSKKALESLK